MQLHRVLSLFLALALLISALPASAQSGSNASIRFPEYDNFPVIKFFLDVHNSQGEFVRGISTENLTVLENDISIPVSEINLLKNGSQFVVSINPGPAFAIRNSQAISRYDTIKEVLSKWAKSRVGSDIDDLSLVINKGPEISHVKDAGAWLERLNQAEIDAREAVPSLDGLFRAVTIANDPTPRPGMDRVILFITSPLEARELDPLENLIMQANQQDVSIHILLVSSTGGFQTAGVKRLMDLAAQTGGLFFAFSGEEAIPDPESYLQEYRWIYEVTYLSAIRSSGDHQISALIKTPEENLQTNPHSFSLDIQPPQAAFIAPPLTIIRQPLSDENQEVATKSAVLDAYEPGQQVFQVIFDFPDGRKRSIISSSLSVDGVTVFENNSPPFDTFSWDLSGIDTDGTHVLQVQLLDEYGMQGTSVEIPVDIRVEKSAANQWAGLLENTPILIGLGVVLSGSILLLVLILGGRLRPKPGRAIQAAQRKEDVLTQPVGSAAGLMPEAHPMDWKNALPWGQRHLTSKAYALLYHLSDASMTTDQAPFVVSIPELLIGSDANWAGLVLHDPSVEKHHARLVRKSDGCFLLQDEGSISGTWINYTPVSRSGAGLEHGDIIHIGKVGFRFNLRTPTHVRQPVILEVSGANLPDIPGLYVKTEEALSKKSSPEISQIE